MNKNQKINQKPITNAFIISGMIIQTHINKSQKLDLLKLLKLLYICFGYISAEKQQYLFQERIEAWELGPVVPDIYFHVRYYADYAKSYRLNHVVSDKINSQKEVQKKFENIYDVICKISEHYFKYNSFQLVKITHAEKSPWDEVYDGTPSKKIKL